MLGWEKIIVEHMSDYKKHKSHKNYGIQNI